MYHKYDRRKFIKGLSVATGSLLFLPTGCSLPATSKYRVFTDDEAACMIALCEQIIPADQDAGATDADVVGYIDRQSDLRFTDEKNLFKSGVACLQSYCKARYNGGKFESLDSDVQINIMKDMEAGKLPEEYWQNTPQSWFFNRLRTRSMQGFYGSPRHGGNRDYAGYRMLKLDYPLLVGQNRYRK